MEVNNQEKSYVAAEQATLGQEQKPECPKSYLVWAILTTCLCCLPFGIYAIVRAAKVEKCYYTGDYENAVKASQDAKKYSIIAAILGFLIGAISFVVELLNA